MLFNTISKTYITEYNAKVRKLFYFYNLFINKQTNSKYKRFKKQKLKHNIKDGKARSVASWRGVRRTDIEFLYNAEGAPAVEKKHYKKSEKDENKKMDKRVFYRQDRYTHPLVSVRSIDKRWSSHSIGGLEAVAARDRKPKLPYEGIFSSKEDLIKPAETQQPRCLLACSILKI